MSRPHRLLGLLVGVVLTTAVGCADDPAAPLGTREDEVVVCAKGATVEGIDVSVWQGSSIDWNKVKASGRAFGIARVSYGTGTIDDTFPGNWSRMKAAGLIRGAYQWFRPAQDAKAQADLVIARVGKLGPGDLPVTADVEETQGLSGAAIAAALSTWVARIEAGTGKKPIIYSGKYFWNDNVGSKAFASHPYWIPAYGPTCPDLASAWSDWKFFQYTDRASVPGVSGNVDGDRFNGSLADLQAFAGIVPDAPPTGSLDEASCARLRGWAQDPDAKTTALSVQLYFDSKAGDPTPTARAVRADLDRADLCKPLGSCNHAFDVPPPQSLLDGKPHTVRAYAIGVGPKGLNPELAGGPKTLTCARPALAGLRRHVRSEAVLAAWRFDTFVDLVKLDDATLETLPLGRPLPDKPALVSTGAAAVGVQLVDETLHRHVQDPASMEAWRFAAGDVKTWSAADYAKLGDAPAWRARPTLVKGSGPAVYLLDDPTSLDPVPVGDAGPSDADAGAGEGGTTVEVSASAGGACTVGKGPSSPLASAPLASALTVALGALGIRRRRSPPDRQSGRPRTARR